jgi:hypothetical protein
VTREAVEPRVSVVIVNYRSYSELDASLHSLGRAATEEALETVVVDNATDPERLHPVMAAHPSVVFVPRSDNRGFAAGVNAGAQHARGRYLLLLNPDAELQAGAVRTLAAFLDSQPEVAIVGPRVLDADGTIQQSARAFPTAATALFGRTSFLSRVWPGNPISRHNLLASRADSGWYFVDWVAGSCMMLRKEAFERMRGFDEGFFLYWEDADLCLRARHEGWRTAYLPEAQVMHHCGRSSRHASTRSLVAFHRSALRYYLKHQTGAARYLGGPLAASALAARLTVLLLGNSVRHLTSRSSSAM